jgi:hypothetical protein
MCRQQDGCQVAPFLADLPHPIITGKRRTTPPRGQIARKKHAASKLIMRQFHVDSEADFDAINAQIWCHCVSIPTHLGAQIRALGFAYPVTGLPSPSPRFPDWFNLAPILYPSTRSKSPVNGASGQTNRQTSPLLR